MGIINYIKEVRGELKHVSWPTKRQGVHYTLLVIAVSLFTAYYLGLFDFIFSKLLDILII